MELDELSRVSCRFASTTMTIRTCASSTCTRCPDTRVLRTASASRARKVESWFIRLPPPNVQWKGTADVLRQVEVLNALDGTTVPIAACVGPAPIRSGSVVHTSSCRSCRATCCGSVPVEWGAALARSSSNDLGNQAMTALAKIHRIDWRREDAVSRRSDSVRGRRGALGPILRTRRRSGTPRAGAASAKRLLERCRRTRRSEFSTVISRPRTCSARRPEHCSR